MRRRSNPDRDREQQRRQAIAGELLHLVAARLLGEARLSGAFTVEQDRLSSFLKRIDHELQEDEHIVLSHDQAFKLPRSDYKVVVHDCEADAIHLGCYYGSHSLSGRLRFNGVLDEQLFGFGVSLDDPEQRLELSPAEEEVSRRAFERIQGERQRGLGRAAFLGSEFYRALAVQPQPGAAIQILAVELYGDGVIVCHSYDDPVEIEPRLPMHLYELADDEPPIAEMLAEAEAEGGTLAPNVLIKDDLGTTYASSGGGEGGVQVRRGETRFTPAVPADAKRLEISTYARTVDVVL